MRRRCGDWLCRIPLTRCCDRPVLLVMVIESNLDPEPRQSLGLPGVRSVRPWLLGESRTRVPSWLTYHGQWQPGGELHVWEPPTDRRFASPPSSWDVWILCMSSSCDPSLAQGLARLHAISWPSQLLAQIRLVRLVLSRRGLANLTRLQFQARDCPLQGKS